jgi:hypothetical protein
MPLLKDIPNRTRQYNSFPCLPMTPPTSPPLTARCLDAYVDSLDPSSASSQRVLEHEIGALSSFDAPYLWRMLLKLEQCYKGGGQDYKGSNIPCFGVLSSRTAESGVSK